MIIIKRITVGLSDFKLSDFMVEIHKIVIDSPRSRLFGRISSLSDCRKSD